MRRTFRAHSKGLKNREDSKKEQDQKNMENRIVMYLHGGSGNHGCEAIVNSTCHMLKDIPKQLVTNSEQEDRKYTLEPLCDILQERKIAEHFFAHVWYLSLIHI